MIDYYVRLVELPWSVEGATVPNDDGSFDIYLNSRLSPRRRDAALEHELSHIRQEHFYLDIPLERMERQAEGESLNQVLHPPPGYIALFRTPESLVHWFNSLCLQKHLDPSSLRVKDL